MTNWEMYGQYFLNNWLVIYKMKYAKNIINDFVNTELKNQYILNDLLAISKMSNIAYYEYECNQYNIIFHRCDSCIIILDAISEEYGVLQEQTRAIISQSEFINILSSSIDK